MSTVAKEPPMADFDLNAALEEAVNPPPGSDLMAIMGALNPTSFELDGVLLLNQTFHPDVVAERVVVKLWSDLTPPPTMEDYHAG